MVFFCNLATPAHPHLISFFSLTDLDPENNFSDGMSYNRNLSFSFENCNGP